MQATPSRLNLVLLLPERFQTVRLVGRCPSLLDVPKIFDGWAQDTEVVRYLVWKPHTEMSSLEQWMASVIASFGTSDRNEYVLAQCDREDQPIGMISLRVDGHGVNFGYVIRRDLWGLGFASEALRYLVDWSLQQDGISRAWAVCDVANAASARVMEKAGLQKEGVLRSWAVHPNISPTPRDVLCYAKTK